MDVNEVIAAKAAALRQQGRKGLSDNELNDLAYSEVVAEMMETALTDTEVMEQISARLQQTDKSLWGKIKKFLQGLVERLKEAYRGLNPDSSIARLARDTIRSSEEALNAFADAAGDAVVNYRLQDGQKNNAPEGELFSIRNTQKMSWEDQIRGTLYGEITIRRNDTLVAGTVSDFLVNDGVSQKPFAIPLSVLTKASSGKNVFHSIKKGKLDSGIKNAPLVIVNPGRNAIVYVTNIKQGGAPLLAAFNMDSEFDGDYVHKATSIHLQIDVQTMLNNLPAQATIYVQNKNELAAVGATNNLRGLAANVKFISDGIVTQDGANVNGEKFSDVVVPDTASQRLLEELSKLGIPYQLYEAENEDQRQQPINSMDNIRFSQRIGAEERVERMETEIQYLKKLVQIQRMGEVA